MKRIIKWTGIVLGSLVGLVFVLAVVLSLIGGSRLSASYEIEPRQISIPTDAAAIVRGQHLAEAIAGCASCHGEDLGGDEFLDVPGIFTLYAANLTSGAGGIGDSYTDADRVRSVRHGVGPDGQALLIMPSEVFQHLGERDLAEIIAYVKSVPPVDNKLPGPSGTLVGRIMLGAGLFGEIRTVELIEDHGAPFPIPPDAGATAGYGQYIVSIGHCAVCHGDDLTGGQLNPDALSAPNITSAGGPGRWTEPQFISTLRTGTTPVGYNLNSEEMPWDIFMNMTDEELGAVWLYLRSLQPND